MPAIRCLHKCARLNQVTSAFSLANDLTNLSLEFSSALHSWPDLFRESDWAIQESESIHIQMIFEVLVRTLFKACISRSSHPIPLSENITKPLLLRTFSKPVKMAQASLQTPIFLSTICISDPLPPPPRNALFLYIPGIFPT